MEALHIVCPHCGGINRIPADKNAASANCGKCHQPLFTGQAVDVDGTQFSKHLQKNDIPVIVDFWADWCGPCKILGPVITQAAAQLEPRVRFLKVNSDQHQALAGQYSIRGIPTLILFKHGKEIDRQSGAMDLPSLRRWIENTI